MSGTLTATGDFTSGFTMVAGDSSPIVFGNDITVATTWDITIAGVTDQKIPLKIPMLDESLIIVVR